MTDTRDLLGGYATQSLSPEERRRLLTAALDDQELFDELVDQELLREVLAEPATRTRLIAALQDEETPAPSWRSWFSFNSTAGWIAAGAAAALIVIAAVETSRIWRDSPGQVAHNAPGPATYAPATPGKANTPTPKGPTHVPEDVRLAERLSQAAAVDAPDRWSLTPPEVGAAGKTTSALLLSFTPDRSGRAAVVIEQARDGERSVALDDAIGWFEVREGEAVRLPATVTTATAVRIVIVPSHIDVHDTDAVLAALAGGQGALFEYRFP